MSRLTDKGTIIIRHARLIEESLLDSVHGFQRRTCNMIDRRSAVFNMRQELRLIQDLRGSKPCPGPRSHLWIVLQTSVWRLCSDVAREVWVQPGN